MGTAFILFSDGDRYFISSFILNKTIDKQLELPMHVLEYKEGATYSIVIEHELGTALIQSSANFEPHALDNVHADFVFLSLNGLARCSSNYRDDYYRYVVEATGAKYVVPIHYDDFSYSLFSQTVPFYGFDVEMEWLESKISNQNQPKLLWWEIWDSLIIDKSH